MDKLLLKLVALFKGLINRQGIDYERMMAIVETKLIMDKRRVHMQWKQRQQKKENANNLNFVLLMYVLIDIYMGMMILVVKSLVLSMIFLHSYVLFMMAMALISDFATVLLDTTDNQVILPKPVSSKTLFMARLVHILIYILQFTIAVAIVPIGFAKYVYGILAGIALVFTVLLTALLAVFLTYILYLLIIKFSSESRIKDIVNYFQIFMTITFTVGLQIVPRLINFNELHLAFHLGIGAYFLPPVWMALTVEAFVIHQFDTLHLGMIAAAFILPIAIFWVMNTYLAPAFARKLSALNTGGGEEKTGAVVAGKRQKQAISEQLAALVCSTGAETSGFQLTWKVTGRDKGFQMQFYPSLAYACIFFFLFIFKSSGSVANTWEELPTTSSYLWLFYIPMITLSSSLMLVAVNENYLASWVYHSLPIRNPGEVISGMVKSLFLKFFVPVFCLLFLLSLYIWGIEVIDDALFAFANNFFCFLVFANLSNHYLPFSMQPNTRQQTGKFLKTMLQLIVAAIVVGLHYLIIKFGYPWLLWALTPLLAVACWLLIGSLQRIGWREISV
ncbi:hypothetical protein [Parasediminibacterium sp. JCM 36343]|uniref:hypothetical protein n=1 Tax=Parasediminibacterium sp. JCM 36343 TaxID=3374279 RepID=UPI00397CE951